MIEALKNISRFDFFSRGVDLRLNKFERHFTIYGQISSYCILILGIVLVYEFGKDVWERRLPSVVTSQKYNFNPSPISVDPTMIPLAFGVSDGETWNNFIDDGIYKAFVEINSSQKKFVDGAYRIIPSYRSVEAQVCNPDKHFRSRDPDINEYFNRINYESLYCLPSSELIGGNYDLGEYYSLYLKIKECTGEGCKPIEIRR